MNWGGLVQTTLVQTGEKAQEGVLASDGFFPFHDSVPAVTEIGAIVV